MINKICQDKNYSTTMLLTKEKPFLEKKPEYKLTPKLFLPKNRERIVEGGLRTKGHFKKSCEKKPLISIVTVVYNGEKHLEQTINSVLEQDYDNVEYIIIDGGSTDGTLDIIRKHEDAIDYWVSEPDEGIYDAMNKGASLCSGDYIAFLNADDSYCKGDVLRQVMDIAYIDQSDFIYGNIKFIKQGGISYIWKGNMGNKGTHIPHPASFVRTNLLRQKGFDVSFKIAADYKMTLDLFSQGVKTQYVDIIVCDFRDGGISQLSYQTIKEDFLITKQFLGIKEAMKNTLPKVIKLIRRQIN